MILGHFKDAVSDVAETIRRAFQAPPCHAIPTSLPSLATTAIQLFEAACKPVAYRFEVSIEIPELQFQTVLKNEGTAFEARLCLEDAWAVWASGVNVCGMPIFRVESCSRLAVPPLPRAATVHKEGLPAFRTSSRAFRDDIKAPSARGFFPQVPLPKVRRDLEVALGLPIAITGEDFQKLPRALNMRYAFQLVKATGENIRNLDVLGVYPVPIKGVDALSHDARTGRILVNLGPEAVGARRGRFILARRKDDRSFVSCFVEE